MSSVPTTKAMENMPAPSAPASCVATTVRMGKVKPHTAVPMVFHR